MDLRTQIDEKYKSAFKLKNIDEINTLRLIRNAIKNKDIEIRSSKNADPINDQQILNILQSMVKQRRDSIESFKTASRNDLIEKEKKEIKIINTFLPQQLNEEEIKKIIEKYIKDFNLTSLKQMGLIMNHLKSNYAGVIDMALAGKLAKELLSS